jgi:hypothetical protein
MGSHWSEPSPRSNLGWAAPEAGGFNGKKALLFLAGVSLTALLSAVLPHTPGQPSFIGIGMGAGVTVSLLNRKQPRTPSDPTGMVLLGLTDAHLFIRDQGTMNTTKGFHSAAETHLSTKW